MVFPELFARFHQLTLFQAHLDEREGDIELYISAKNFKVLQLCFKITMPSLLDTSIKSLICLPFS